MMTDHAPLESRHALITGGGTGIGAAVARGLGELGASLTLVGRRAAPLEETAASLSRAQTVRADVTDESSIDKAFDEACDSFGEVTILINNAGAAESAPLSKTGTDLWERMLAINLTGTFLCSRAFLARSSFAGYGRIVNIASTAGLKGYPYVTAYCAAKHGVIGLTRALALEMAQKDVTVNAVCPGYTQTELIEQAVDNIVAKTGRSREEAITELAKSNPQGRLVQPDEVASVVAWLCLSDSQVITGQAIAVAGGEVM